VLGRKGVREEKVKKEIEPEELRSSCSTEHLAIEKKRKGLRPRGKRKIRRFQGVSHEFWLVSSVKKSLAR